MLPDLNLHPNQSVELLKALHILTRDGKLNQDSRRKLKQVYHLYQFIEPLLKSVQNASDNPIIVDHGAGKSYLGFILYDLFLKQQNKGAVLSIESRVELVQTAQSLADKLGFSRMQFAPMKIQEALTSLDLPAEVEIVTALHACDTATDDAIQFGITKNAQHMVLVPCCQAEVAAEMRKSKNASLAMTALSELWRHPIHTREFGSHLTNILRCLQLQAHGYDVTVTELVGWEHSMKNELIIATKNKKPNKSARERLQVLLQTFNLTSLEHKFNFGLLK